jgi:hypothetical protein
MVHTILQNLYDIIVEYKKTYQFSHHTHDVPKNIAVFYGLVPT